MAMASEMMQWRKADDVKLCDAQAVVGGHKKNNHERDSEGAWMMQRMCHCINAVDLLSSVTGSMTGSGRSLFTIITITG